MGIKEELEKLAAAREAHLARERILESERLRREYEEGSARAREARRVREEKEAGHELGRTITSEVLLPVLQEAVEALNQPSPENNWNVSRFNGTFSWLESEGYGEDAYSVTRSLDYDGYGAIRFSGVHEYSDYDNRYRRSLFARLLKPSYTSYDILFAGRIGESYGMARGWASDQDGFGVSFGKKYEKMNGISMPSTTPETLENDLAEIRLPNSQMNTDLRSQAEQALLGSIRSLPEYHTPR